MPSVHQHAGPAADYDDEVTKMVATKDASTLEALIRGMDDTGRIDAYIAAEIALAEDAGRDPRKPLIGRLTRRRDALPND